MSTLLGYSGERCHRALWDTLLTGYVDVCYKSMGDTHSSNLYKKLAMMHVTKILRFDWSAVFESF